MLKIERVTMSDLHSILKSISDKAFRLKILNLKQAAADFDFLVIWLKSAEFHSSLQVGTHVPPNPAGVDTIDSHSNNCPIPFTVKSSSVSFCKNHEEASEILSEINALLDEIDTSDPDEIIAITKYKEYISSLIYYL